MIKQQFCVDCKTEPVKDRKILRCKSCAIKHRFAEQGIDWLPEEDEMVSAYIDLRGESRVLQRELAIRQNVMRSMRQSLLNRHSNNSVCYRLYQAQKRKKLEVEA